MCGIHGFAWKNDGGMVRMLKRAEHRGPDDCGIWGDDRMTLGHNLLAITDVVESSAQPWHHGDTVLAFNGEIYNYRDLRKAIDYPFRTDTDTEVLAAGLATEGVDFLRRVDGMFALAFYDQRTQELVLARDTNGAKPLYYGYLRGKLAFSSEISSLLELGFDRVVSREGFRHFYYTGLNAGPVTLFDGILKLVPGQIVRIHPSLGQRSSNLNDRPVPVYAGPREDLPRLIQVKLQQAVGLSLSGRRQVGMLLSGGIDSSSVLHEAVTRFGVRPETFTTRFDLPNDRCRHNEDADAAAYLSQVYKTRHHEVLVTEQDWIDDFEATVRALEEPRQGKSYPAYLRTLRAMREAGTIVALSGDGGDELMLGYKHQMEPPFTAKLRKLRAGHRELKNPELQLSDKAQEYCLRAWLPKGGLTGDSLNDFMYTECLHTLSEDFLIRNDKLGAAFGMEARFPMMCSVFRDFVRGIPGAMKVCPVDGVWDKTNKWLMRQAYGRALPARIVGKGKTGWRAPTDDWLIGFASAPAKEGPMRAYFRELLRGPEVRAVFEITDADVEDRYLNNRDLVGPRKESGKHGAPVGLTSQKELFTAVMFAAWVKEFNMRLW